MKVILTGASGFVGSHLKPMLVRAGHEVRTVGRGTASDVDWDPSLLGKEVARCDAIIHLAGENLFGKRWNAAQKAKLRSSRIDTTKLLAALAAQRQKCTFVSSSAVGWYGPHANGELDESSARGSDFLADLCQDWEQATEAASAAGVRTVRVRTGVVLGLGGGALAKMLPPFRFGVGGPLGNGKQWVSWVHIHDLCRLFQFLIETPACQGVYNGTAPSPVTMSELAKCLGRVMHRPALFPVPGPILRAALGECADVLLTGQKVLPRRALAAGFQFEHPELEGALSELLSGPKLARAR